VSDREPPGVIGIGEWRRFPAIDLPSPVLALLPGGEGVWASGLGGVARYTVGSGWSPSSPGLPLRSVAALASAGGSLLAGGHGGIAQSRDDGRTWRRCSVPDDTGTVTALSPSPHHDEDGTALAATLGSGILRTTDFGQSWQTANFGLQSLEVLDISWGTGETVIAATSDGLFRSPNAGRAWRALPATPAMGFSALATTPDGEVLAAPETGPPIRSTYDLTHPQWFPFEGVPDDVRCSAMLSLGMGRTLFATAEHGLLLCDGGCVWFEVSPRTALSLAADGSRVYAGTDTGVMMSDDRGETWTDLPMGPLHDLHRLLLVNGAPLVAGTHSPPVIGDRGGWLVLPAMPLPSTGIFVAPNGTLFVSTPDGLHRSHDRGASWESVVAGTAGSVTQMTFAGDGRGWAGVTSDMTLLRSPDGGHSWHDLAAPFGVAPLVALQAIPGSANEQSVSLIAAIYNERQHSLCIWRSDDEGEHWTRGADSYTVWPAVQACGAPPLLAVGTTITVRQPDGAWRQSSVGETGLRRVASNGTIVVALARDGLWRSGDYGLTWSRVATELPHDEIMDVAMDRSDLYVLLTGGRLWSRPL
jgi:photosystem II stability/assembly factor-like uncharacterized protein